MIKHIGFKVSFSNIKVSLYRIVIRHVDTTAYSLNSPANAERLLNGIENYEKGAGIELNLVEE